MDIRLVGSEPRPGGMCTVHEAWWFDRSESVERHVALKLLKPEYADNPDAQRRFRLEAAILCNSLRHKNVVHGYGTSEINGQFCLVMEWADTTLAGLILGRTREYRGECERCTGAEGVLVCPMPFPPECQLVSHAIFAPDEIVALLDPIGKALVYLGNNGIIHRDIKPSNVLLVSDPMPVPAYSGPGISAWKWGIHYVDGEVRSTFRVVVSDFGIARDESQPSMTSIGSPVGTPDFMSPEQVLGKQPTAQTDVYSLGVVLFCLLTGHPPFGGEAIAVQMAHVNMPPPLPSEFNRLALKEFDTVVARAMSKDPAARYESAAAFLDDLKSAAARRQQSAPPSPVVRRSPMVDKRILTVLAVLVALAAGWYLLSLVHFPIRPSLAIRLNSVRIVEGGVTYADGSRIPKRENYLVLADCTVLRQDADGRPDPHAAIAVPMEIRGDGLSQPITGQCTPSANGGYVLERQIAGRFDSKGRMHLVFGTDLGAATFHLEAPEPRKPDKPAVVVQPRLAECDDLQSIAAQLPMAWEENPGPLRVEATGTAPTGARIRTATLTAELTDPLGTVVERDISVPCAAGEGGVYKAGFSIDARKLRAGRWTIRYANGGRQAGTLQWVFNGPWKVRTDHVEKNHFEVGFTHCMTKENRTLGECIKFARCVANKSRNIDQSRHNCLQEISR
ncbi:MAG: serine/threonine protein kinase [Bryobacterales bacterium]|nr:serine/threonine protein kinase [Bryobacterales bacterium]